MGSPHAVCGTLKWMKLLSGRTSVLSDSNVVKYLFYKTSGGNLFTGSLSASVTFRYGNTLIWPSQLAPAEHNFRISQLLYTKSVPLCSAVPIEGVENKSVGFQEYQTNNGPWYVRYEAKGVHEEKIKKAQSAKAPRQEERRLKSTQSVGRKKKIVRDSLGESFTRAVLERLFPGSLFSKAHPHWLVNPLTGAIMELDCYNEELKLAVEYDGPYHDPSFNNVINPNYARRHHKDLQKNILCERFGVRLIRVRYTIKFEKIEEYIREQLTR